jgi:hypothetical protein
LANNLLADSAGDRDALPHQYPFGLRELAGNSAARYLD